MTYTKLDSGITDSTIWQAPDTTRLVWITMLAMADWHGYIGASIPGLAARARVPLNKCLEALDTFMAPDPFSRTKDHEGRRIAEADGGWVLLNHSKYREKQSEDDRRERSRLAMQSLRAKRKETVNDVSHALTKLTHTDTDTDTEKKRLGTTARSKGTRLPPDFAPDMKFAEEHGCGRMEFDKFRDYWDAVPGQKGVKLNWNATWRNWCRNARPSPVAQAAVTVDSKAVDATAAYLASQQMTPEQKAAAETARRLAMSRRVA
jgi:hypothetical protein